MKKGTLILDSSNKGIYFNLTHLFSKF